MKSSIKISIAVATGAIGTLAGVGVVSDWRPFTDSAKKQALERRINDLENKLEKAPKVFQIGAGGGE